VAGEEGQWEDVTDFPAKTPAPYTKLTAARSDDDDANIHVFYQDAENNSIKQLMYEAKRNRWRKETDIDVKDAKAGTSLSVVSGDGELRLFYQNGDGYVKEQYSDTERPWGPSKPSPKKRIMSLRI
jgi:hypothetical protein